MKLIKPKFWNKKFNLLTIFLLPVTFITILIIFLKKKISKPIKYDIPIICIGNIYIGGTGKTPLSLYIGNELLKLGKKPVILKKFYKEHKDEHNLISANFNNLILNKKRDAGILEAKKRNFDTVILDDGFQDYKIKKDLNILCFNSSQLIGNGFVLPSGPLRENLSSLKEVNIIFINGEKNIEFEKKILDINKNLKIFYTNYKPVNVDQFKGKKLLAVSGIGNPNNFFQLLLNSGLEIEKKLTYPDHYEFTENELLKIIKEAKSMNAQVIVTEKDYYRIKNFKLDEIKYLKVSLNMPDREKFIKIITELYD